MASSTTSIAFFQLHPVFYDRSTNANTPNVPGSAGGKPFHVKDVNVASSFVDG